MQIYLVISYISVGDFIPTNYELKKSFLHLDD